MTDSFRGTVEPVKVSGVYRLGLLLVASAMALLPLIYLGMIVGVGYGLYLHAVGNTGILGEGTPGLARLVIYAGPLIAGAILLVFMIKPLFARSAAAEARSPVHRTAEPALWAFVEQICEVVGAPVPKRIYVDCDVNASAGFRRGLLSFVGNDLVLNIGLPLAAGLSLRQFAGVLAHEFGHFGQGAGMRLSYVVRSISHWFSRVVYERDMLDVQLERWSRNSDFRLMIVLLIARLFIWVSRRVLWILMVLGHGISCFMLRQMEFDADRYEARMVGSDCFASTARQLRLLGAANQYAYGALQTAFSEGRLVESLPQFVHSGLGRIPGEVQTEIDRELKTAATGLFDTHPSDRDRIASASREKAAGIFHDEAPATTLFKDFDRLCQAATRSYYRQMLGPDVPLPKLVSCDSLVEGQAKIEAGDQALRRFFRGVLLESRALRLPVAAGRLAAQPNATLQQLKESHQEMKRSEAQARVLAKRGERGHEKSIAADQAATLLGAGITVSAKEFGIPTANLQSAQRAAGEARTQVFSIERELEPYFTAAEQRLQSALSLLPHPKLAERIEEHARLVEETPQLVEALSSLAPALEDTQDLRRDIISLTTLLGNFSGNEDNAEFVTSLQGLIGTAVRRLGQLGAQLESAPYPFEHADDQTTIGRYVLGDVVLDENNPGQVYQAIGEGLERLDTLYLRVLGRLVDTAIHVEQAVGLQVDKKDPEGR